MGKSFFVLLVCKEKCRNSGKSEENAYRQGQLSCREWISMFQVGVTAGILRLIQYMRQGPGL